MKPHLTKRDEARACRNCQYCRNEYDPYYKILHDGLIEEEEGICNRFPASVKVHRNYVCGEFLWNKKYFNDYEVSMKINVICTWCGFKVKDGETARVIIDCSGSNHYFHPDCYNELKDWFSKHD